MDAMDKNQQSKETSFLSKGLPLTKKKEEQHPCSIIPKPFECAECFRPHNPSENKLKTTRKMSPRFFFYGKECVKWNIGRTSIMDTRRDATKKKNKKINITT